MSPFFAIRLYADLVWFWAVFGLDATSIWRTPTHIAVPTHVDGDAGG